MNQTLLIWLIIWVIWSFLGMLTIAAIPPVGFKDHLYIYFGGMFGGAILTFVCFVLFKFVTVVILG